MSVASTVITAVVTAFALICEVICISMWFSARKTSVEFKKERPDASNVNGGRFMF